MVHSRDPVLANNQRLWQQLGMENVGIELHCEPQMPYIYLGAEEAPAEPQPMFRSFAWNVVDHCNYMGIFMGPRV